ncbi:MAG: dTDP-4-dehydrorhamnose 3,5-epimerase [Clostridia bacterium]|nr:dTDP-4-dehydrorhamnose 3,5-epimerase [Clostridia bacterium]
MDRIKTTPTPLAGLVIVETAVYRDARGYFTETYNLKDFSDAGLPMVFVQDNQSYSVRGVLRGLHFQKNHSQGKLVRVLRGEVFDVGVDLRPESPTYKQWFSVTLTGDNKKQLYLPEGFAHGFVALSETAELSYKCTAFYNPAEEAGIRWDDPDIGINWPIHADAVILSDKDALLPFLRDTECVTGIKV